MADSPRKTIAERAVSAVSSGSLDEGREEGAMKPVVYLRAMALAGIHDRVAGSMWRLVANGLSPDEARQLGEDIRKVVRHLDVTRDWKLSKGDAVRIANEVVAFVLSPACPTCKGRGYEVVEGTGRLSDRACPACHGNKIRRINTRYVKDVLAKLEDRAAAVADEAMVRTRLPEPMAREYLARRHKH